MAVGRAGFLLAVALPVVLWHRVVGRIAAGFRLDLDYLVTGWSPWVLMGLGLVCLAVAGVIDRRGRERRFHTAGSAAWVGWGVSLYLLGFGLATQVAQIADGFARG